MEVRNLADGTSRGRQPRELRTRLHTPSEGRENPRREWTRQRCRAPYLRNGALGGTEACGSRFRPSGRRQTGRWKTSWPRKRRGGCGEPMSPLHRTEWSSERHGNPVRVARTAATPVRAFRRRERPWRGVRRPARPTPARGPRVFTDPRASIDSTTDFATERGHRPSRRSFFTRGFQTFGNRFGASSASTAIAVE